MNTKYNQSCTTLITGATSGIGLALAETFAQNRHPLVLVARRANELSTIADRLSKSHGIAVETITADLSSSTAADRVFEEIQQRGLTVDILVNNAGAGQYGFFLENDADEALRIMQLNMISLTRMTSLFLPPMVERHWGRILNVSSLSGLIPGPLMAVYHATKAYVTSFSESIGEELRGTGVTVTVLYPGLIRTGFQERAQLQKSKLMEGSTMDINLVAQATYKGVMAGKPIIMPGLMNKLQAIAPRFLPRRIVPRIVRRALEG